jgi:endonuclease G
MKRITRTGIPFILDPRILKKYQVGDELYAGNRLDRGHIARRADLLWGPLPEAEKANTDSFYFTNITPQMDDFNQSTRGGLWGKLEEALFEEVDVDNLKVSVFGGPIFRDDDRAYRGVKIPREFYKVLAYIEAGQLKAKAFMLTQSLDELEVLDLDRFKVYQVALREVEQRGGFRFPNNLRAGDSYAELLDERAEIVGERAELEGVGDIVW